MSFEFETYTIKELQANIPDYRIGQPLTKNGVIELFDAIRGTSSASDYQVGITCDIDRREGEHDADFLAIINCSNIEDANELEKFAHTKGYYTGLLPGNAHKSESIYLYIFIR